MQGRRGVEMMRTKEKLEFERRLQNPLAPGYLYSADYIRRAYPTAQDLEQRIAAGQRVLDSLSNIDTDWFEELVRLSIAQPQFTWRK